MSDWATSADDWASAKLATEGAAMPPATMTEIVAANWRHGAMLPAGAAVDDAYANLEKAIRDKSGLDPSQFTDNWNNGPIPMAPADRAAIIGQHLDKLDQSSLQAVTPLLDVQARAKEAIQKNEEFQAQTFARTYGLGGNALGWAAYLTRQMVDPVNLAAMAIAGPEAGTLLQSLGREFAVNAGVSAGVTATEQATRGELGLPHGGLGDVALSALEGGAFGAGLGLAVRGAGAAWRAASPSGMFRGAAAVGRRLIDRGVPGHTLPIHPDDAEAVANLLERDQVLADQATPPTPIARAELPARVDRAAAVLEGGRRPDGTPIAGGGAEPSLFAAREAERVRAETAAPATEGGAPTAPPVLGPNEIARPGGGRLVVTPRVVELRDLTVSHTLDGKLNPNYPQELQGRDRSSPASRSWVAEKAAELEPLRLGLAPTAQEGAPIVGSDGVVEAGNGRAMLIARAYDRHPERAAAYRAFLEAQGFKTEGMDHPVLVRVRQGELAPADRASFAREANVSATAGLSTSERAFSDASLLGHELLGQYQGGELTAAANVPFVRAFAERVVAAEERPNFISGDNRLSSEGARRLEAALVARAYQAHDVVDALYQEIAPSSRAILGALVDNAPKAARVKAEIEAGRIAPELDPSPALLDAYRLVERARNTGQRVADMIAQIDLEHGAVSKHTVDAVDYYFRDPPKVAKKGEQPYRVAAGRQAITPQINRAMDTALSKADAAGDLLGLKPDAGFALREGGTAEMPPGDLTIAGDELAAPPAEAPAPAEAATGAPAEAPAPVLALEPAEAAAAPIAEALKRTGPGSVRDLMASGASDAEIAAHPDVAAARQLFAEIKARTGPGSARDLIAKGASEHELEAHPDVKALNALASAMPDTMEWGKPPAPEFDATRVYNFDGERVVGFNAAVAKGVERADSFAGGTPLNERKATIVIGPPAVGKSYFAEAVARRTKAAIVDTDEMKPAIPGYLGGIGAGAVHNESSHLIWDAGGVRDALIARGANMVIPRIGNGAQTIRDMVELLKEKGYQVDLVNVAVKPDEAYRRMIKRALDTGRIIQSEFFRGIGDKPTATYHMLEGEGQLYETASIDNNGPRGGPTQFLHGADTELGRDLAALTASEGRGGGDQLLHATGGRGDQGAVAPAPRPGGVPEGVRPRAGGAPAGGGAHPPEARGGEGARPGAGAREVTPPKPIGDPQLEAEAQNVVDQVGDQFLIQLADPESDAVRTVSIADARAEIAEADAAADELFACMGMAAGGAAIAGAGAAAEGAATAP